MPRRSDSSQLSIELCPSFTKNAEEPISFHFISHATDSGLTSPKRETDNSGITATLMRNSGGHSAGLQVASFLFLTPTSVTFAQGTPQPLVQGTVGTGKFDLGSAISDFGSMSS